MFGIGSYLYSASNNFSQSPPSVLHKLIAVSSY